MLLIGGHVAIFCGWRTYEPKVSGKTSARHDAPTRRKSGVPPEGGLGLIVVTQRTDLVYADGSAVIAVFGAG